MGIEQYAGRVALVTGASSGIGAAIAQALQRHGLVVVGMARRVDKIKEYDVKGAPGKLYAVQGDVTNEESILAAFKWVEDNLGGVDILINNAGVYIESPLSSSPTKDWKKMLDVNLLGVSICTREAVQSMLKRGVDDGYIIHINSIAGHIPPFTPDIAMYSASKHALRILLEGLRKDLLTKKSKIRVGEISPGGVKSEIYDKALERNYEFLKNLPVMESEDIAAAAVYMLSQPLRVQVDILSEYINAVKEKDCEASLLHYFGEDLQTVNIHKVCSSLIGKLNSSQTLLEILSKTMTADMINMVFPPQNDKFTSTATDRSERT